MVPKQKGRQEGEEVQEEENEIITIYSTSNNKFKAGADLASDN